MARLPEPSRDLPWVLRQKGLRLIEMATDEEGHTRLVFQSPYGNLRQVEVVMLTEHPVTWVYGYTIRDKGSKTKTTYSGKFGDPSLDVALDIETT
jgi:hypothetical protein